MEKYYFDTSIWLDLFENRDEPNIPKGEWIQQLMKKIVKNNGKIILSEVVKNEMGVIGYNRYEIEQLFYPLKRFLIQVYSTKKQFGKAKDLANKRGIPLFDALHALIARDYRAILVTLDRHFDKIKDIISYKKPKELI